MRKSVPDFLIRLRKATRSIHTSVEAFTDSERLLSETPKLPHYQRFLAAHYLLHMQVSSHCRHTLKKGMDKEILDWPDCPRIQALDTDLRQQNIFLNTMRYVDLPYQSHGFTLGLVYVCEGSCIGNRRVLSALNRVECFHQWGSRTYLDICKVGFSDRWKLLLGKMHSVSTDGSKIDGSSYNDIEQGAIAGFNQYMYYWNNTAGAPTSTLSNQH